MSPTILKTTILLILSNVFMTFAWYAHLKNMADRKGSGVFHFQGINPAQALRMEHGTHSSFNMRGEGGVT